MNGSIQLIFEGIVSGKIDQKTGIQLLNALKKENNSQRDIAIIGVSAKLPGVETIEGFWQTICNGFDCIGEFPGLRKKDADDYLQYSKGTTKVKYSMGAYLKEIDKFDYEFFRISPKEASLMSPNQRLFLETAFETIEDAGYGGDRLAGTKTGVYTGFNSDEFYDYKGFILQYEPSSISAGFPGNFTPLIANRISYILDLKGPSIIIDSGCSSSLVAVHLACRAIRNGECDLAIAGSVRINLLRPENQLQTGMEAADGRAKTFDDSSDGTGSGEGVIVFLLKSLSKAIEDRDNIYAVIKGSAVNQDGSSIGITAPNVLAQEEVIVGAWEDAQINPETIQYIEAHGTGTILGDPIEVDGIKRAFKRYTDKKQFCAVGSIKTNIGHLDHAAGMAGLLKAVLALKNKILLPTLNFNRPNRKIDFTETAVYVNDSLLEWEKEEFPRRCGVSSFGLGGTNCHMVLEESPAIFGGIKKREGYNIFTISAKSKESLNRLIDKYKYYIINNKEDLNDICYTANTGRGHYNYRLAFVVNDIEEFKNKILSLNNEELDKNNKLSIYYGQHKGTFSDRSSVKGFEIDEYQARRIDDEAEAKVLEYLENKNDDGKILNKLCQLYVLGANIKWSILYKNQLRRKVSIPFYQFQRKRCWVVPPAEYKSTQFTESITKTLEMPSKKINLLLEGREYNQYSETERTVGEIWSRILGFNEINIFDNFYELGGDSLIATRIIHAIGKELGITLEISDFFNNLNINSLSNCIDKIYLERGRHQYIIPDIYKVDEQGYYPLSSAQKRFYILNQIEKEAIQYNEPATIKINGRIDKVKLENAIKQIIKRQGSLRTSFEIYEGNLVQHIHQNVEFKVNYIDACETRIDDLIKDFIKPFDLTKAPILRIMLISINEDKHFLVFDTNHIISDAKSMQILLQEFISIYKGDQLPDLELQYKDFTVWQNNLFESDFIKEQESYWLSMFSDGIPILNILTDYPRSTKRSFEGESYNFEIRNTLFEDIKRLVKKSGTSEFMILLTSFYILISKYTLQEDMVFGTPIAGRKDDKLENIIGVFINTLPLRNKPSGSKTVNEFLEEVKINSLNSYKNQDYQFDKLVDKLVDLHLIERVPNRNPIFDIFFSMHNFDITNINVDNLTFTPFDLNKKYVDFDFSNKSCKFDLHLDIIEASDKLKLNFQYSKELFSNETILRLAKAYLKIIEVIIQDTEIQIKDIEILDDEEKHRLESKVIETEKEIINAFKF